MINAGAIITCSLLKTLIKPEMTLAEKFDYTLSYFQVGLSIMLMKILKNKYFPKK